MASLALALAAGFLLRSYVTGASSVPLATGPRAEVVVASNRIDRGKALSPADLRLVPMPVDYSPPGALSDVSKAAGRVALADLAPGEVVTETRLARVRAGPVASLVPRGLRAFAVPTALPPGLVAPGDLVDVLAAFTSGQVHIETVVSGVEVLVVLGPGNAGLGSSAGAVRSSALDLDAGAAGLRGSTTLVLLVSPAQQERLAFARAFASLEVTLAPPVEGRASP